ncbi:hypothetical protein BaRGS_00025525, partial [Batillaria attramentaria]
MQNCRVHITSLHAVPIRPIPVPSLSVPEKQYARVAWTREMERRWSMGRDGGRGRGYSGEKRRKEQLKLSPGWKEQIRLRHHTSVVVTSVGSAVKTAPLTRSASSIRLLIAIKAEYFSSIFSRLHTPVDSPWSVQASHGKDQSEWDEGILGGKSGP